MNNEIKELIKQAAVEEFGIWTGVEGLYWWLLCGVGVLKLIECWWHFFGNNWNGIQRMLDLGECGEEKKIK